jgi:WD40 repeat protein
MRAWRERLAVLVGVAAAAACGAGQRPWPEPARLQSTLDEPAAVDACSLAFSPDGKRLAVAGRLYKPKAPGAKTNGPGVGTLKPFDPATGKPTAKLKADAKSVEGVAFSPDGKLLATGGTDMTVRLWDVATRKPHATLTGHRGFVTAVAFSPDGKVLASGGGSGGGEVRLWDVAGRKQTAVLTSPHPVHGVAFSPDGKWLAAGDDGPSVRLWEVASGKETDRFSLPPVGLRGEVYSVVFSRDGQTLAVGAHSALPLAFWDLATEKLHTSVAHYDSLRFDPRHEGMVRCVAYSPDGSVVATAHKDLPGKSVRLWHAPAPWKDEE